MTHGLVAVCLSAGVFGWRGRAGFLGWMGRTVAAGNRRSSELAHFPYLHLLGVLSVCAPRCVWLRCAESFAVVQPALWLDLWRLRL